MNRDRAGFTIVELLVVTMLGLLLLMAVYQVLLTNQRTYRENAENVQEQQSARMALNVLAAELREISSAGGDITAIASDSIAFTAMHRFGVICAVSYGVGALDVDLTVQRFDAFFKTSDPVVIFADNDTDISDDDTWIEAQPNTTDSTGVTCSNGATAQDLEFLAQSLTFEADSVRTGAPIRSLENRSYGVGTYNGASFLMRTVGGTTTPIAGPLDPAGVTFAYYEDDGSVATDPDDVHKIVVTVNSGTELATTIYPRN